MQCTRSVPAVFGAARPSCFICARDRSGAARSGRLSSVFKGRIAKIFFATASVAVILLGAYNLRNGFNLLSFSQADDVSETVNNDVQTVRMTQNSDGYSPNVLTVKKGKKYAGL